MQCLSDVSVMHNAPQTLTSSSGEDSIKCLLKRDVNETFPRDSEKDNVEQKSPMLICTKEAREVDVKS